MTSQSEKPGQGRAVLLLIAGIPLTMMLAASWLWYFVVEGDLNLVGAIGTANNGTLISPPRELQQVHQQSLFACSLLLEAMAAK
mgnify:CR=1 FL=1